MAAKNEPPPFTIADGPGSVEDSGVPGNTSERVTVNLTPRAVRSLNNLVMWTGYTKTDTINRALQIYAFLQEILEKGGSIHVRQTEHGDIERLTFF